MNMFNSRLMFCIVFLFSMGFENCCMKGNISAFFGNLRRCCIYACSVGNVLDPLYVQGIACFRVANESRRQTEHYTQIFQFSNDVERFPVSFRDRAQSFCIFKHKIRAISRVSFKNITL